MSIWLDCCLATGILENMEFLLVSKVVLLNSLRKVSKVHANNTRHDMLIYQMNWVFCNLLSVNLSLLHRLVSMASLNLHWPRKSLDLLCCELMKNWMCLEMHAVLSSSTGEKLECIIFSASNTQLFFRFQPQPNRKGELGQTRVLH